jgi:hypothetical protein
MASTKVSLPDTTGLTFEKVWAMFQETIKETKQIITEQSKETEIKFKELAEQSKETDRRMKETDKQMKETDRRMKKTDKLVGDLCGRFGEMSEHLVAPGVADRFNALGYHFNGCASGGFKIYGENGRILTEIDILLENTKTHAVIEIKSKPVIGDIEHLIKRIKIFQRYLKKNEKAKKTIIGAIAGAVFLENVKNEVIKAGFYVITQSGDTVKIDVPKDFKPREF